MAGPVLRFNRAMIHHLAGVCFLHDLYLKTHGKEQ